MRRTVWTYGLIAGAILSVGMLAVLPFADRIGFDRAEVLGYTTIIAAFLMIFFGVRSHRDNAPDRAITFRRAFTVGLLINVIASLCYVVTWQVIYYRIVPDFGDRYAAYELDKARAEGATPEQLASKAAEFEKYAELFRNPLVNAGVAFLEPFVVGVVMSLLSAGILRRRGGVAGELARGAADMVMSV